MKVQEIIQRVQSLYSKGAPSRSSRLMSRQIYSVMLSVRSTLLFNKINKKQFISLWNYVTLPCVELIQVSQNECPCIIAPGCQILRSKFPLPKPLNSISKYMIKSVTSIDGLTIFAEVTYLSKNYRKYDKYTSLKPDYFIKDDYLYISITRKLKAVSVVMLAHDPYEALSYPGKCDTVNVECPPSPFEIDFSIDEDLVKTLIEMVSAELLIIFQPKEDTVGNSQDDGRETQYQQSKQRQEE
jgi:hypothetical protein